ENDVPTKEARGTNRRIHFSNREKSHGARRTMKSEDKVAEILNKSQTAATSRHQDPWCRSSPLDEKEILLRDMVDTNIKGTANVLRHFVPLMIEKRHGIIINLSSGWGRSAAAEVAPYCASKWAIEGLTRSLAKELPPGLAAIALSPGVVNTDMLNSCFGSSAALYQTTETWAPKAATMILSLSLDNNGASLT
ncbi:hypothetical protein ACJX0J_028272, partial [Zea mays]